MLRKIKKYIKNNPTYWRYIANKVNSSAYATQPISANLQIILKDLNTHGIAFGQFNDIFEGIDFGSFALEVNHAVLCYEDHHTFHGDQHKTYFDFVLGLNPSYEATSKWNQVASHTNLQTIADAYFRMKGTEMRYYNIWRHKATDQAPSGSQLWHRDREDLKILKVFICLEDVGEKSGPFSYAPGTQLGGHIKKIPKSFTESDGTSRTTDEMMNAVVPKEHWIKAIGKKGDVIFADTHGYHKGGYVEEGERLLFTTMYVSPACGRRYFSNSR